jgi:hypothetical protein
MTLCSLIRLNQYFGGAYCHHFRGGRLSPENKQAASCYIVTSQKRGLFIFTAVRTSILACYYSVASEESPYSARTEENIFQNNAYGSRQTEQLGTCSRVVKLFVRFQHFPSIWIETTHFKYRNNNLGLVSP